MADETLTIHAARRHDDDSWPGGGWYYVQTDDGWYALSRYADGGQPGGTRAVRIATGGHPVYVAGLPAAESADQDDDRREALAWASRQFASVNVEDAHAIGDAVLSLANRYHAWLRGDRDA